MPATVHAAADLVTLDEFRRLDLRVGQISDARPIEGADRLLRVAVDLGTEERTVVAGLARAYAPAELIGATVVVLFNVEPATIRGIRSDGMLLGVQCDAVPVLLTTAGDVEPGTRVT
jgi:methionine--tRNA ligase beta chain